MILGMLRFACPARADSDNFSYNNNDDDGNNNKLSLSLALDGATAKQTLTMYLHFKSPPF